MDEDTWRTKRQKHARTYRHDAHELVVLLHVTNLGAEAFLAGLPVHHDVPRNLGLVVLARQGVQQTGFPTAGRPHEGRARLFVWCWCMVWVGGCGVRWRKRGRARPLPLCKVLTPFCTVPEMPFKMRRVLRSSRLPAYVAVRLSLWKQISTPLVCMMVELVCVGEMLLTAGPSSRSEREP